MGFLHNSPTGPRMMCDMHAVNPLEQFLVNNNFEAILNDIDYAPLVIPNQSRCTYFTWMDLYVNRTIEKDPRKEKLFEEDYKKLFFAPEQISNFTAKSLRQPRAFHTEKIDVWKVPNMVVDMLSKHLCRKATSSETSNSSEDENSTRTVKLIKILSSNSVEGIFKQCKSMAPLDRPSMTEIVDVFEEVLRKLLSADTDYLVMPDDLTQFHDIKHFVKKYFKKIFS